MNKFCCWAPPGAGQSTLLDAIRGVVPHSVPLTISGECFVAGQPIITKTVAEPSATVGSVPQDPHASIALPLVRSLAAAHIPFSVFRFGLFLVNMSARTRYRPIC